MNETLTIRCPHCGRPIYTQSATPGRTVRCSACRENIQLVELAVNTPHCSETASVGTAAILASGTRQTDPCAILCFAAGLMSIFFLPIVLMPVCYASGILSYYRLKENRRLKGQALRLIGWFFGTLSFLYLLWVYQIGPFHP